MKKVIIALVCALLPIYKFITWILIFNNSDLKNQAERVKAYHETYFFNLAINETYISLASILLISFSIFILSTWKASRSWTIFKISSILVLLFIGIFNVWGLL